MSVYSKFRFLNYVHNRYVGIPTFPNGHLTSNKGGEEITAIKPENCTKYNSNWTVNYYDETPTIYYTDIKTSDILPDEKTQYLKVFIEKSELPEIIYIDTSPERKDRCNTFYFRPIEYINGIQYFQILLAYNDKEYILHMDQDGIREDYYYVYFLINRGLSRTNQNTYFQIVENI